MYFAIAYYVDYFDTKFARPIQIASYTAAVYFTEKTK